MITGPCAPAACRRPLDHRYFRWGRENHARGTAAFAPRPAGIAHIDGERVDVVSEGEFVEPDAPIEVIRVEGNRVVVRRHRGPMERE